MTNLDRIKRTNMLLWKLNMALSIITAITWHALWGLAFMVFFTIWARFIIDWPKNVPKLAPLVVPQTFVHVIMTIFMVIMSFSPLFH